jgi:hypothetical protein
MVKIIIDIELERWEEVLLADLSHYPIYFLLEMEENEEETSLKEAGHRVNNR